LRVAPAAIISLRLRSSSDRPWDCDRDCGGYGGSGAARGAQEFINRTAAGLGPGIVRIDKASFQDFVGDAQAFAEARAKRPDVSLDDYRRLRERLGDRLLVGARIDAALPIGRGNRTLDGIAVQGVPPISLN
jgi:hypothetical protein